MVGPSTFRDQPSSLGNFKTIEISWSAATLCSYFPTSIYREPEAGNFLRKTLAYGPPCLPLANKELLWWSVGHGRKPIFSSELKGRNFYSLKRTRNSVRTISDSSKLYIKLIQEVQFLLSWLSLQHSWAYGSNSLLFDLFSTGCPPI